MSQYEGEAFVVRRGGVLIAEPTGGLVSRDPDAPPQSWFAGIDDDAADVPRIDGVRAVAEIDLRSPVPNSGLIGRVRRLLAVPEWREPPTGFPPPRSDDAINLLELVPDDWQAYEVRFGELDANRWEAFVETLFPVPVDRITSVLGAGWQQLVRVEPWLLPRPASESDRAFR